MERFGEGVQLGGLCGEGSGAGVEVSQLVWGNDVVGALVIISMEKSLTFALWEGMYECQWYGVGIGPTCNA